MELKIKGNLKEILSPISGTSEKGKDWTLQEFTIVTRGDYPKTICFQDFNNKCNLENLSQGADIEVYFNVESREYNNRYYTNLTAWKVVDLMSEHYAEKVKKEKVDPPVNDDLPF